MEKANYASMVEENTYYPVSYTIKQDGTKVIENKMLKGGDMTENQIKELQSISLYKEDVEMLVSFLQTLSENLDNRN